MKASDIREKTASEMELELIALRKEQFNLTMQKGSGQTTKSHLIRAVRRNIARVKTILSEKMMLKKTGTDS